MAVSNHERVGRALSLLREGLYPFIEREMQAVYRDRWLAPATASFPENYNHRRNTAEVLREDASALLILMCEQWQSVFKKTLGQAERNLVSELRSTRNQWAHHATFSTDDAYRALDSVARLLSAVSAHEAIAVEKQKQELLRIRYGEEARRESRKAAIAPVEGRPIGGLKPWREIITPHQDVASGRYQQAEFAADLWQVYLDEGSDEYRLPTEFFRRTFLTDGLQQLLVGALLRLSGKASDPVIELQTNFGGGKTHAMLSLYHLFLGVSANELPGLEPIFTEAGISEPPSDVKTVVLVGNKVSPGQPQKKKDGTIVRTLWGELAWQLDGREAYEIVRQADETATNPGDTLKVLFNRYAPCLILIDEWVAYARQLHEENDLPGGSFDTHFTFAQTLSESAKNAERTLLVVSIPSSDIEIGGDRGKDALIRLKNAIGRVESPWRPASAEESFEIVRRRLFQPISEPELFAARDAVVRAFSELYRNQAQEFPIECREAAYEQRLRDAYPIHPELFDRLYSDWSSLDKFQRTRGVLRLMAKVIHSLWDRQDKNLLILPANVPVDDTQVQPELTRYLDDNWVPVIEKDVDGHNSLPVALDRQNPNLGRYSACRRITRTIYLGSAPTLSAANRGLEDRRIKLGCVQPGESVATFGDALRRLTDQATYLYPNGNRYWISTQPNVTRTAQDRATQIQSDSEQVWEEVIHRLRRDRQRGEFAGVHIAPDSTADVPDEKAVRLVVLGPQHPHSGKAADSPARQRVGETLNHKGASPRYCKNMLLFLAPDRTKLDNLMLAVCQYLSWDSIVQEKEALNLDVAQSNQAITKRTQANQTVELLINEAYQWLLIPIQPDPQGPIEWQETRLQGQESPIVRASRKLIHEEHLITTYAANSLRVAALDLYLWKDVDHIDLKKLWEYLATYVYLPRLKNEGVLLKAVQEGVSAQCWTDNFAYASNWDQAKQRYLDLRAGAPITATLSSQSLLVKPEVAQRQRTMESNTRGTPSAKQMESEKPTSTTTITEETEKFNSTNRGGLQRTKQLRRFHGSINLNSLRLTRDVAQVADEVLQHFTRLVGAEVEITLDIQVYVPEGLPEEVVRIVNENCRTLKFNHYEVEEE